MSSAIWLYREKGAQGKASHFSRESRDHPGFEMLGIGRVQFCGTHWKFLPGFVATCDSLKPLPVEEKPCT